MYDIFSHASLLEADGLDVLVPSRVEVRVLVEDRCRRARGVGDEQANGTVDDLVRLASLLERNGFIVDVPSRVLQ